LTSSFQLLYSASSSSSVSLSSFLLSFPSPSLPCRLLPHRFSLLCHFSCCLPSCFPVIFVVPSLLPLLCFFIAFIVIFFVAFVMAFFSQFCHAYFFFFAT